MLNTFDMNFSGGPVQLDAEVANVIQRTEDVMSVRFRRPKGSIIFRANGHS